MIMLQDHYIQGSRKNYEADLQYKQNTSKQLFSDPEEIWELENVCDDLITSGNDSDPEDNLFDDFCELPDGILEGRRQINTNTKKTFKNVRFESSNFNYANDSSDTSSVGNKYVDVDCRYAERRRSLTQEPEIMKMKDGLRGSFKQKWRPLNCCDKKFERRPKSSPEKSSSYLEKPSLGFGDYSEVLEPRHKTRKKGHKCGKCCGDVEIESEITRKFAPLCKHDFGDNCMRQKHFHCCDHYPKDEGRKKNYQKVRQSHKPVHNTHLKDQIENIPKTYKKVYRQPQEGHFDALAYNSYIDHYCQYDDCYDHTKSKKKTLEAVQEQQEHFSDSTYKLPSTKLSNQTIPGEAGGLAKTKSSEKLTNSSQSDWKYCSNKHFGENLYQHQRIHKLRSRRTRMNRLKNGWKKAFVQTVRDGSRNERVGVLIMGPKGPEFFSKNQSKPSGVPFRKSQSFLEGENKGLDVVNSVSKNVFPSSSEPGPQTNYAVTDFICPEEDLKVEEKIAKFNKNFNDILKTSEEKFFKALSKNDFSENKKKHFENIYKGAGEGGKASDQKNEKFQNETKYSPFPVLPVEGLSPRVPRVFKKPEMKINEESKAKADALNEKAKQYKENQLNLKNKEDNFLEELKELQEKFPPKELISETADGNLSLWGLKLEQLSQKTDGSDDKKEQKDGINVQQKSETNTSPKINNKEKIGKDEMSQTGSIKSNDQMSINKQRRKKYFETTTMGLKQSEDKNGEEASARNTQTKSDSIKASKNWADDSEDKKEMKKVVLETDRNFISAVFRDLVENGCAISQEESENLQNVFNKITYNDDTASEISSGVVNAMQDNKINESLSSTIEKSKHKNEELGEDNKFFGNEINEEKTDYRKDSKSYLKENSSRKTSKIKNVSAEKLEKKGGTRTKSKKKILLEDKMKLLRQALPGIAAEKEATHLKQLKKYIDRFIERVEASTSLEYQRKKNFQSKEPYSTDSSEVRVDAKKILDIVSNPFERISSDVTINIAKKLTDALVQEKTGKAPKYRLSKSRTNYENESYEKEPQNFDITSGSERHEELEPTYLKQLKKMRNEHLNNIVMEVKRLSELLRFLDRCNHLAS